MKWIIERIMFLGKFHSQKMKTLTLRSLFLSTLSILLFNFNSALVIDDASADASEQKPCCLPETWHGFLKTIFGKVENRRRAIGGMVTTEMFVDGQNKRTAAVVSTGVPKADFTFVGFFNEDSGKGFRFYAFKTFNATKCWTYYWDKFEYHKPCLPETSNFKGSFLVGPKTSGLNVNVWGLSESRQGFSFAAEIIVTQDGCLPVALREVGRAGYMSNQEEDENYEDDHPKNMFTSKPDSRQKARQNRSGKKFVVGAIYNDLELYLKDDAIFNLPLVCKKNLRRYPPKLEDLEDPETEEGFENLEAIMEHVMV